MLVANKINETGFSKPKSVSIGETVKIVSTNQMGEVVGYTGGRWQVKTTDGNVVEVMESQIETRTVLLG